MKVGKVSRKIRSDKKREIKPTIPYELKEAISIISYVTSTPVKDVTERICTEGFQSRKVIENLSPYFRRTVRLKNTLFIGDLNSYPAHRYQTAGKTERISVRFLSHDYENITTLAYALDCTPSKATALLLDVSIRNSDFVNSYFKEFVKTKLDDFRMQELQRLIRWLNNENPYEEGISWGLLLSYIFANMKDGASTFSDSINDFIDRWR